MVSLMNRFCIRLLLLFAWYVATNPICLAALPQERLANPFEPIENQAVAQASLTEGQNEQNNFVQNQDALPQDGAPKPDAKPAEDAPGNLPQPGIDDQPAVRPEKHRVQDQRDSDIPPMFLPQDRDDANLFIPPARKDYLNGGFKRPYLIDVNLGIDDLFKWYLTKSLSTAKEAGADLVVIRLTTLGGELHTSLQLASKLLEIDWATVVIWIPDEAISGGAIVSMGADAIYMKPSATIGDVGIIHLNLWGAGVLAEEKEVSYYASVMRQLAVRSGRHPEVVASMMDRKLKVVQATEKASGKKVYLTEGQSQNPAILARVKLDLPLDEAGNDRFLTVSGTRAKQLELCEETFDSESSMLKQLTSVVPVRIQLNWRDELAFSLNGPWISGFIVIVGLVCLYIEFTIPGVTLPGLISMCCFALFFWSHLLVGTAGGLEIMMFLLGAACLMLEIFLLPGFGIFGIAGLLLVGLSLLLATQDFLIPQTREQWQHLERNGLSLALAGIVVAGLIAFQLFYLDTIPGFSKFQLKPEPMPAATVASDFVHPAATLNVGMPGMAHSDLRPSGKALIDGQYVDVVSDGDYVERGTAVQVIRIEGNIVTVRKC